MLLLREEVLSALDVSVQARVLDLLRRLQKRARGHCHVRAFIGTRENATLPVPWPPLPTDNLRHAGWLYLRFTLSYRDVEDMLAERGLDVSHETVRRWVGKFGPLFARELRCRRPRPTDRWHLDEMVVAIAGKRFWLWRAVDDEGEVLDLLVQPKRNTAAAVRLGDLCAGGGEDHSLSREVGWLGCFVVDLAGILSS